MRWCRIVMGLVLAVAVQRASGADFDRFAFSLQIQEGNTVHGAGTGSLVKLGKETYYVSAQHVFEKSGTEELAATVKSFTVANLKDPRVRTKVDAVVPISSRTAKADILVLKVKALPQLAKYTLKLAPSPPQVGDTVFLAARLPGRELATYPIRVDETADLATYYEKIPGVEKYTGASGGPILNEQGELVGTYLGRQLSEDGSIKRLSGFPYRGLKNIGAALGTSLPPALKRVTSANPVTKVGNGS